tara:strand:+ start:262 stop:561 length:300 start_codon:yes stop_codon:yes gene_type:complete
VSEIEIPSEDDIFFDKDHIVFYTDESGEIKCKYAVRELEYFQDLILAILSGAVNEGILKFLIEDLSEQGMNEEAVAVAVVRKLLETEDKKPIVKPSNFR